jgi:hypothetical protein
VKQKGKMSKSKKPSKTSGKNLSLSAGIAKKEKSKRSKYLTKRITALYDNISEWMKGSDNFSYKKNSVNVDGEKLPALEIRSGKKNIISLKPNGLYAFGVNCRIDIISDKETNVLFDIAKETSEPDWQLISSEAGKKPKKLTKMIFRNLLKKQNQ